jgi:hypothetical protein
MGFSVDCLRSWSMLVAVWIILTIAALKPFLYCGFMISLGKQVMKGDSLDAYAWVEELQPNTWIKAFFSDFVKCDMLLNNHSEVFNRYNFPSYAFSLS